MEIAVRHLLVAATFLLVALALTACTSVDADGNQTINFDPGGNIGDRLVELNVLSSAGTYTRIEGTCASTCTMHLWNMRNGIVCIAPDARLQFHGSTNALGLFDGNDAPGKDRADWLMAQTYPANLQKWYWEEGRFDGKITTYTGADLYAMDPGYIVLCGD